MTYDVIKKNKEINDLENNYFKLCQNKRSIQEDLMQHKYNCTKKLNAIDAEISNINLTLGRIRREFHLNKVDASRVEKLRKQFGKKRESLFKELVKNSGKKCHYCINTEGLEIHHLLPLSHGGENNIENLVLTCQDCHEELH